MAEAHHIFGGLLVGQALRAAHHTTDGSPAHSLSAVFLAAGDGGQPTSYEVEATRDGGTFLARRVVARQAQRELLVLTAQFHADEQGAEYETTSPMDAPDGLPVGRYDSPLFESRDAPVGDRHARVAWFRAREPQPDDPSLHQHALAFVSDHGPTRAAREPHDHLDDDSRRLSVSLNHSVWFHRPARVDQWLAYELTPAWTGRGRGLALGSIRDASGALLATVAQEVLLRSRWR